MTYLDTAILNGTEWLCRRFQLLTGRTNVWLALQLTNLSIIVYFVWAGVYFWNSDRPTRVLLALFCGGLLYVLTQTIFKEPIEAYESSAYRRVANGLRNPRRVRDVLLRIPFLTLSLVLLYPIILIYVNLRVPVALLSYSLIVLTTVVLYLLACDPLPPCAGRVREWLKGSARSPLAAPESIRGGSNQPAPRLRRSAEASDPRAPASGTCPPPRSRRTRGPRIAPRRCAAAFSCIWRSRSIRVS